jgi:four helix bundle protein
MDLAVRVHQIVASFPAVHRFELGSQLRKAATSVPSNVAEGHAQRGDLVFLRHVRIAIGSLAELDTQLELAARLNLVDATTLADVQTLVTQVGKLLHGLRRTLRLSTARTIVMTLAVASVSLLWL